MKHISRGKGLFGLNSSNDFTIQTFLFWEKNVFANFANRLLFNIPETFLLFLHLNCLLDYSYLSHPYSNSSGEKDWTFSLDCINTSQHRQLLSRLDNSAEDNCFFFKVLHSNRTHEKWKKVLAFRSEQLQTELICMTHLQKYNFSVSTVALKELNWSFSSPCAFKSFGMYFIAITGFGTVDKIVCISLIKYLAQLSTYFHDSCAVPRAKHYIIPINQIWHAFTQNKVKSLNGLSNVMENMQWFGSYQRFLASGVKSSF